jgi:hypothetical protein
MTRESIEPSEIITNKKSSGFFQEQTFPPNPFLRFLARAFDYSLFLLLLTGARFFLGSYFPQSLFGHMIPFEYLGWIPIEACLLHFWGTTPGKFLCKIQVKQGRKETLSWESSFSRSWKVWFRGIGMGIPIVSFVCMFMAFNRLKLLGFVSWDREDNIVVSHQFVSSTRLVIISVLTACGFLFYYQAR